MSIKAENFDGIKKDSFVILNIWRLLPW